MNGSNALAHDSSKAISERALSSKVTLCKPRP